MTNDGLARWASDPRLSRGCRHAEPDAGSGNAAACAQGSVHRRDRERIVDSTAFRRLAYKTQVFINHEGDLFRTRLTHTLEVAQLSRSAARALRLNEDLAEAIALAHDLGHTPFGHAGQDALHGCMREHGGFEHNLQSLRIVDELEVCYPDFDGLNLSFETREGILKHCSRERALRLLQSDPGNPAARFLSRAQPSLEAQLVNLCDEMAYQAHDIDDGLRAGLITLDQLGDLPLFARMQGEVVARHPVLARQPQRRLVSETLRRMLASQLHDLVETTARTLAAHAPVDADAVRGLPPLVRSGDAMRAQAGELERLLHAALYRHPRVERSTARGRLAIGDLFAAYSAAPSEMPADYAAAADLPRSVADYIAGMTDRFALREHRRLTGRQLFDDS